MERYLSLIRTVHHNWCNGAQFQCILQFCYATALVDDLHYSHHQYPWKYVDHARRNLTLINVLLTSSPPSPSWSCSPCSSCSSPSGRSWSDLRLKTVWTLTTIRSFKKLQAPTPRAFDFWNALCQGVITAQLRRCQSWKCPDEAPNDAQNHEPITTSKHTRFLLSTVSRGSVMSHAFSSPYQTRRCHSNHIPWTAPAAGSPSLLSITWLFPLLFTPSAFLRLVPWLIPRGWRAAATPGPWGWSAILAPAAWPFLVVISFPLITWICFFLVLVPRFYFTVCSWVRSSSGAASSTTIISVVTIVISSTVRCKKVL